MKIKLAQSVKVTLIILTIIVSFIFPVVGGVLITTLMLYGIYRLCLAIVKAYKSRKQPHQPLISPLVANNNTSWETIDDREIFREAAKFVVSKGTITNSSLGQRFSIGYVLSGQILGLLESAGIVAKGEKGIWRALVNEGQLNSMSLDESDKEYQKIIDEWKVKSNTDSIDAQSHLRIINDSLSLIDKTTNLDTLNSRYSLLLDEVDWVYAHGYKLSELVKREALDKIAANKNENLVRVTTYINNSVSESLKALKTDIGRKNAGAKAMQRLSQCITSLVEAPNKANSLYEITKMITGFTSAAPSERTAALSEQAINEGAESVSENRIAEQDRWQKNDAVVGCEIKLGTNKDHCDICEQLAGKYPKSFKWDGWYDGCRCYQVSIMKPWDEFWADLEKEPEERIASSKNNIIDVPENFKQWVKDNAGLIRQYEADGTAPSFITNNKEIIGKILKQ